MIAQLTAVVAPVFLCTLIGYIWGRSGRPFDTATATDLSAYLGTPCLILAVLPKADLSPQAFGEIGLASAAALGSCLIVGAIVLKLLKLPLSAYLPTVAIPNAGNLGVPVCMFAFGEPGLALGIVYMTTSTIIHFTIGMSIAAGDLSMTRLARTPVIYAVGLALWMLSRNWEFPKWIFNTVDLIGGLTFPVMLLTLGVSLGRFKVLSLRRSVSLALMRLGMGFVVGYAVAAVFGLHGPARGVVILETSMASAVFNYLFAQMYQRRAEEVASIVLLSTALGFITLPLILSFLF